MLSRLKQFLTITLIMVLLVSTNFSASAIPVFSIGGTVTDERGNPVTNGTEVILTNKGRNLTLTVKVGEGSKAGTYAATFATIEENGSVAEAGEELSITVNDATGKALKLNTASYRITAADIAAAKAVVNLQTVTEVVPPATVTLNASPETLPGDGVSQSTITATVKDAQGNTLPSQTVTFTITKGSGRVTPIDNNRATYTSAQAAGEVEITGVTSNGKSGTVTLKLTQPIKASPTLSTIIATTPVVADGASTSKITITLLDESRQPVPGKRVKLTASGEGNTLTQPTSPTDAAGRTTATLASTKAESKRITAMVVDDGLDLADGASVNFQSGPAATLTVAASPNTLSADGTSVSTVQITLTDRHGNPVTGEVVSVVASAGTVTSPAKDNNDGTYQSTYTASTAPGTVTLTASTTGGIRGEGKLTLSKAVVDTVAEIQSISVTGSPAKAGVRITVTLIAEPKGEGRFSIAGVKNAQNLLMPETSTPGEYIGGYTVTDGDNVTDAVVTVTFKDAAGNPATKADQVVTLDTTPPPAPTALKVEGGVINRANQSAVVVTGNATPNANVRVTLDDLINPIEQSGLVDSKGEFRFGFNASALKDGIISVRAVEADDAAGNAGISATINVLKETQVGDPDFSLNSPNPDQTGDAGKSAVYTVAVLGTNNFNGEVKLTAAELPAGISGKFSPNAVTPTQKDPQQFAQLTLTINEDAEEGKHAFAVFATSGARFKRLDLTLTVRKIKTPTFLTLQVEPPSVPLGDKMNVSGTVGTIEGALPTGLPVTLTYQTPAGTSIEQETTTNSENRYTVAFTPEEVGPWQVTARWEGNAKFSESKQIATFEVKKGVSKIKWNSLSQAPLLGQPLHLVGVLDPPLEGEEISLRILRPSGIAATIETVRTGRGGIFEYTFTPDERDEKRPWTISAIWVGNTQYNAATVNQDIAVSVERAAIVLLGGGNEEDNPYWERFNGVAQYVYTILQKRTFSDGDIYFLSPSLKKTEQIDDVTSKQRLEFAITDWAGKRVNANVPLLLYLISHNTGDQFLIEKRGDRETFLSVQELADMLNLLPPEVPVTIVVEACRSGNFIITKDTLGKPLLPRHRRTVIASARSDVQAQLSPSLSSFSKIFFDEIDKNKPLGEAFEETEQVLKRVPRHSRQFPQIDANGNGTPNESIDFREVAQFYIPENIVSLENEPQITKVIADATVLPVGKTSARVTATVIGPPGIPSRVFATVTPPNYDPSVPFTDWGAYDVPTIEFVPEGEENRYVADYDQFTQPGVYTIVVFAENPDGSALPVETTITVPEAAKPTAPWDVDGNGRVDILDLVQVATNFGKSGTGVKGDVNGDGTVNILDLVLVSSHFGEITVAAAPSTNQQMGESANGRNTQYAIRNTHHVSRFTFHVSRFTFHATGPIREAVHALEALPTPSREALLARDLLREWLKNAEPIATETRLLPNYPNPFNPETWIPYQLARPAAVTLSIYEARGRLIRTLALGHQAAGFYTEPAKAAHWDGRNAWGESVASGVYFYQLKAGDFTAMRRMVILK